MAKFLTKISTHYPHCNCCNCEIKHLSREVAFLKERGAGLEEE